VDQSDPGSTSFGLRILLIKLARSRSRSVQTHL